MELESEHLAPYSPYGLEIQVAGENRDDDPEGLPRIFKMVGVVDGKVVRHNPGYISNVEEYFEDVFPILRPLSDLNDKHGEDVVNEHYINILIESEYKIDYGVFSHFKGDLSIELNGDSSLYYDSHKSIDFKVMLTIQEQLFGNHYDVFGLIKKGLAIDINTL